MKLCIPTKIFFQSAPAGLLSGAYNRAPFSANIGTQTIALYHRHHRALLRPFIIDRPQRPLSKTDFINMIQLLVIASFV